VQNLVDKILKQLPKGAKSIPAFEDDSSGELPSLTSIVRRIVSGGQMRLQLFWPDPCLQLNRT
jgi:hypothetical protein